LELDVHEVCQTASGGSYVAIFEADVELVVDGVEVQILATEPADESAWAVESAREAIRRGAEKALLPTGKGAIIHVKRLVIHPIDFKPRAFERFTEETLTRLLQQ